MNLYEINEQLQNVFEECVNEDGEISEQAMEQITALNLAKDEKVENIVLMVKNLEADAEKIGAESQKLAKRAKECTNKAKWLKNYLIYALKGEKFKSARCSVSYRKNSSVECTLADVSVLPAEFLRSKPELNKTAVKEYIANGGTVEGCAVVESVSVVIR